MKTLSRVIQFAVLASCMSLIAMGQATAPAKGDKGEDADSKQLQGTWNAVSLNINGEDKTADLQVRPIAWRIEGTKLAITTGKQRTDAEFALDVSKTPKRMAVTVIQDSAQGTQKSSSTSSYELDGNTLKVALFMDLPRGEREVPKDFKPGAHVALATLERQQ
jgi:uncharacterized protein (TIGR03067 family)